MYRPSELFAFLENLGIQPKKTLSQNFLIDGNIIQKIVSFSGVKENEWVIEIGSGPGCLTEALLQKKAKVLAIEKDDVLGEALKRLKKNEHTLDILIQDILKVNLEKEITKRVKKNEKAKVIANLPYHITTPILEKLTPLSDCFSSITVLIQEEAARRFTAHPGEDMFGFFPLYLSFYGNVQYGFKVVKGCFFPRPKVDSAIIKIDLKKIPEDIDQEVFFAMAKEAFLHRRKMLRSSLRLFFSSEKIQTCLGKIGKKGSARPEELSLDEFISLYYLLFS